MSEHDDVVDAELVEEDRLPAIPEDRAPAVPLAEEDPDAWLPPEAQEDVAAGIPRDTSRAYEGDMQRFAEWCESVGRRVLPAAPQTVTAYLSYLKRTPRERTGKPYGPASMDRIIASIRSSHRAAGFRPPDTMGARKVVAGYREQLALANDPAAQQKKATPADRKVLRQALARLDRTKLVGKRDAALMLLGHALASRGSELAPLDWPASFTDLPEGGLRVWLYRKKRKKWQDVEVLPDPDPELCSVAAVRALVEGLAHEGHTSGPLFLRIDQWGYIGAEMNRDGQPIGDPSGRISVNGASDVVSRSIARTGLPGEWRSHSLRRGFVKSARDAGVDIVDIGRHGGWDDRSKALIGYIDEEDSIGERNPLARIGKKAAEEHQEQGEA
ncbi:integrase [Streptomyces sp. ISL-10]|uniref:integrase n=1 Tax=Streptomyces sp. ISL-10 TaxID=2819172 RepID=UPI001BECF4AA|nr:integrase [Streptomyces sp. ISL-10]MBT2368904.1 integrase [Streptomyces sp. ISL-10]